MAINLKAILSVQDRMTGPMKKVAAQINRVDKITKRAAESQSLMTNQFGKITGSSHGVSKSLGSMSHSAQSYGSSLAGVVSGIGAVVGAHKALESTVGAAMEMEQSQIVIEAMIDDSKLSKQYQKMIDDLAIKSPVLNTQDVYSNSKSFLSLTDDIGELEQYWKLTEKLAAVDPAQGVEGAVLALRELASGDTMSMVERFELPRGALNDIKSLPIDQQLTELDKLFNKLNMTDKLVEDMGGSSLGVINRIKEALQVKMRGLGFQALSKVKPVLLDIEKAVSDGKLNGFFTGLGSAFAFIGAEASKFSGYIKENWPTIMQNFETTKEKLAPVGEALTTIYDGAKKVGDYVIQNWPQVLETVIALTAGIATFKAGMATMAIVQTVTGMMKTYRTAVVGATTVQALFNGVLLANPIGLVVAGIAALVAAAVLIARNWDVVKAKTVALWDKLGAFGPVALKVLGPIGNIINAAINLGKHWDSTKGIWENVWSAMKQSAADAVNSVIDKINMMIGVINKIPGVNVPLVAKVDWGEAKKLAEGTTQYGAKVSGGFREMSAAGGLSYVPSDGTIINAHRGERVLTKAENEAYSSKGGGGNTYQFYGGINLGGLSNTKQAAKEVMKYLADEIEIAGNAGA